MTVALFVPIHVHGAGTSESTEAAAPTVLLSGAACVTEQTRRVFAAAVFAGRTPCCGRCCADPEQVFLTADAGQRAQHTGDRLDQECDCQCVTAGRQWCGDTQPHAVC